jgi:PAS domain-containing protein
VAGNRHPGDVTQMVHETLLGEALGNVDVAAAVTMDDGRYIACNDAFCRLVGYTRDEILALAPGADGATSFGDAVAGARTFGQAKLRRKDGGIVRANYWLLRTRAARAENYLVLVWPAAERPKRRDLG